MKTKIFLYGFGVLAITLFFYSHGWTQSKPDSKAPIITSSFAVEKGYYGYVWRFYIEAEGRDSDMQRIVASAYQPGYGNYTNILPIVLKPQFRHHLKGYIQWNSFSFKAADIPEWTQVTLKISIVDKAGHESNEVIFPITIESGVNPRYELPAPFDQGEVPRLGYLDLNLVSPFDGPNGQREF
jgi:hypothetical protein